MLVMNTMHWPSQVTNNDATTTLQCDNIKITSWLTFSAEDIVGVVVVVAKYRRANNF